MEAPTEDTAPPLAPPGNGRDAHPLKRVRRRFTTDEKRALVSRHVKSGLGISLGAKALDLQDSVLRRWVATYGILKASTKKAQIRMRFTAAFKAKAIANLKPNEPQVVERAKKLGIGRSTLYQWLTSAGKARATTRRGYTDEQKMKTLERWERGGDLKALAAKMGLHQDSIRGWWKKFRKGPSPRVYAAKKAAGNGSGTPKRKFDHAFRKAAVDRLEQEKRADVQTELGVSSGMMTNWIKAVAAGDKKIQRAEKKAAKLVEREHRDVVAIETVHAIPNGSMHDTIVYLRHARDEANKLVRSGRASVDDPIVLYSMLALNASGGGHR
jgi:transposase-like protein